MKKFNFPLVNAILFFLLASNSNATEIMVATTKQKHRFVHSSFGEKLDSTGKTIQSLPRSLGNARKGSGKEYNDVLEIAKFDGPTLVIRRKDKRKSSELGFINFKTDADARAFYQYITQTDSRVELFVDNNRQVYVLPGSREAKENEVRMVPTAQEFVEKNLRTLGEKGNRDGSAQESQQNAL